jgi:hypothetical protein
MRNLLIAATLVLCGLPAPAFAQSGNVTVQGFGGLTFANASTFLGETSTASSFGGLVTAAITPNLMAIGEVGRLSDVKPGLLDLLDYTPVGLHVSAWYGSGGVRFITSGSAIRPYGEATAGYARLSTGVSGLGELAGEFADAALPYLNQTEPMFGLGGGVLFTHGRLAIDAGYRYRKILTSGVSSALGLSDDFHVNEVRFGAGVRF